MKNSPLDVEAIAEALSEHASAMIAKVVAPLLARIAELEARQPEKGDKGDEAKPITDAQISDAVAKHLIEHPIKDGDSIKGDPGRGIGDALIDANGNLVLTFTDGAIRIVGLVKGRDGVDAKGKDGFSADELIADLEGDRTVTLKFRRGEELTEIGRLVLPVQIYRGVFDDGRTYERGDTVTWAGSLWHCNAETISKPGDGSKDWTLAAKKGRDAKEVARV